MSQHKRNWFRFEPLKSPSEAFVEYLEGYASSLDMYSICPRYALERHDIGAVLDDFWDVVADFDASADEAAERIQETREVEGSRHEQGAIRRH